jgi:hypothetical protein
MMLIVLPNLGSVFSSLSGVPDSHSALASLVERNHTTYGRLYTYVLLLFRISDDENDESIRRGPENVPSTRTSGEKWHHQCLWENQTNGTSQAIGVGRVD